MRRFRRSTFAVAVFVVASSFGLRAGGPLAFDEKGPFTWSPGVPIDYSIDRGPIGAFPEPVAQKLAQTALDRWAQASTTLTFRQTIMANNVTTAIDYLSLEEDDDSGSVLVLDDRGDIVAMLAGEANRDRILGWASPLTSGRTIGRFVSLMNGELATNEATFASTLTHEFGHALGLDHAQINSQFANNNDTDDDKFLPTMFPTSTDDDSTLVELNPDDVSWIRALYPTDATKKLYGRVTGRLTRGGKPLLGANVIAVRTAGINGAAVDSLMDRFSCVSDYLTSKDGSFSVQVLPGTYKFVIEPIRKGFSGGSSVGPYAEKPTSPSFVNPIKIFNVQKSVVVGADAVVDLGELVIQ